MENHNFSWENPLFLWPCSIAMLAYQRVTNSVGLSKNAEKNWDFLNDLNHIRSWISLIAVEDGSVDWLKAKFRKPESLVIYHREWRGSCKFGYNHLGYVIITVVMCSRL